MIVCCCTICALFQYCSLEAIARCIMKCFFSFCFSILISEHFRASSCSFIIDSEQPKFLNKATNNDTLILAQVIYRHGDRNINMVYPNDPHKDEIHWPGGLGQLTNEGKRQLHTLGQYFRRRYGKILGSKYSTNEVYVQSTDVDRTLMSAQANLAGLFPPTEDEIWNKDIFWQPIPVHTVPKNFDHVISAARPCPKYTKTFDSYVQETPEVQRIYKEYAHLFKYWSEKCGVNLKTILDVYWLYNTLEIEHYHNKTLEQWALEAIKPNGIMEYMALFHFKMYTDTPTLARLKSGFLIKEIVERFSQKINSTLKPNRSLWLYSAHDITMTNMLNSLGLFELHNPSYASSLHFELYKTDDNEYYMQLLYRNSQEEHPLPMNIPNCGTQCSLDRFYAKFNHIIPGDFESECKF